MFGRAYRVGKLLGFQIEISVSFLVLLAFILLSNGMSHGLAGIVGGLLMVIVLFGSVIIHELGHAVVARRYGVHILGIELHFVGGAAKMAEPPRTAREEVVIAIAGPLTSFALAAVAYVLALATGWSLFGLLALINAMLGAFNLVPALPMDGGRVLRALLSERVGRYRATHVAANVAQGLAFSMIGLGVLQAVYPLIYIAGAPLSGLGLILVGFLVWVMAAQERAMAGRWHYADEMPDAQVVGPNGEILTGPSAPYAETGDMPASPFVMRGPPGLGARFPGQTGDPFSPRHALYRLPNGQVILVEEHVRW